MNATPRLIAIAEALTAVGVRHLILGGHAVRHYGLERNTVDVEATLAAEALERATHPVTCASLLPLVPKTPVPPLLRNS